MKKVLSIILVAALILSLALLGACSSKKEETPAETTPAETTPAETTPAETTEPATDAPTLDGQFVAVIAPTLQSEWLTGMLTSFCEQMEDEGCSTQLTSAEGDNAKYISLIENFMTMDAGLILVVAQDAESVQDVCERAMAQGIFIIMLGLYPDNYEISGGVASDFYETGWALCDMASYWLNERYPDAGAGEVHASLQLSDGFSDGVKRGNGMKDRFAEDPKVEITYIKDIADGNVEKGFTMAEEAFMADPDVKVFCTYDPDPAVGINNYIMQTPDFAGILDTFGVFCTGSTEAAQSLCDLSETGESVLRGILTYGGEDPGITLHEIATALMTGTHEAPYWIFDACYTYTHLDYEYIEEEV